VTGANKGIGYEIARLLGAAGLHVVITSRDEGRGKDALKKLQESEPSAKFDWCQADITDAHSIERCAKELKDKYGKVNVLINNAGIAVQGVDLWRGRAADHDRLQPEGHARVHGRRAAAHVVRRPHRRHVQHVRLHPSTSVTSRMAVLRAMPMWLARAFERMR
jgi:NAD(P)-dependent dehydrogenase (short-subunit alcohol dehydrogenase family)